MVLNLKIWSGWYQLCNSCVVVYFWRTRSQSSFRVAMEETKFTRTWATSSSRSTLSTRWRYTPGRYVLRDFIVCFLNAPVRTYLVNNALNGACRFLLVPLHLAASFGCIPFSFTSTHTGLPPPNLANCIPPHPPNHHVVFGRSRFIHHDGSLPSLYTAYEDVHRGEAYGQPTAHLRRGRCGVSVHGVVQHGPGTAAPVSDDSVCPVATCWWRICELTSRL